MSNLNPKTKIGHVHLTVADLERSLKFYRDILGFEITASYGDSAVFLSAGGYHHYIGLNTWAGKGATPPPPGHTGLYHFAILFLTRKDLAQAVKNLLDNHYPIAGASDHGVSEAIYIEDPDSIGVELYWDRPEGQWPRNPAGELSMTSAPLDLNNLLAELD